MSSLFSSFFQLAGAKSFSEFLKEDDEKRPKRRSLKKTVAQRRRTVKGRKTPRRTARRTVRRTARKTNRIQKVRKLTNRKLKGKPGKYECVSCSKGVKAYFKGNEPSPKGLGYCARCTPLKVIMKGKDGNLWENKKYSKGKRWVRVN
jgi:Cft2 family RNA processing exonuclease